MHIVDSVVRTTGSIVVKYSSVIDGDGIDRTIRRKEGGIWNGRIGLSLQIGEQLLRSGDIVAAVVTADIEPSRSRIASLEGFTLSSSRSGDGAVREGMLVGVDRWHQLK